MIIASGPLFKQRNTRPYRIVLRYLPENVVTPYVVHTQHAEETGLAWRLDNFSGGAYHADLQSAMEGFAEHVRSHALYVETMVENDWGMECNVYETQ